MNVLSLFDGISCGLVALKRAGIPVTNYYASEIDKYAIQISEKNHPEIKRLGDIRNHKKWDLPKIDLLIGGSPCQGFSLSGHKLNFNDPRSVLFFNFVECVWDFKPKYFLLENIKRMNIDVKNAISELIEIEPVEINSSDLSAQNRERLYWANFEIKQPEKKNVFLKDIVEQSVDESFFLKPESVKGKKSIKNLNYGLRKLDEKSKCLTASGQRFTNAGATNLIIQTARGFNKGGLRAVNGKTPTLSSSAWQHNNHLFDGDRIRRLTPLECERLQTLPDNYTEGVSNTQRYKMIGNGWTVDVISHILKNIKIKKA